MKNCLDCGSLKSDKGNYCKKCGYKYRVRPSGLEYNIKKENKGWLKKGVHPKTEFKRGFAPWNKDKSHSKNTKNKISEALKGHIPWNKDKHHSAIQGKNHWNWKEDKSSLTQKQYHSLEYKKWRQLVFKRDNFICQKCGKMNCYLEAHHIKERSNFPELIYDVDNGLTLCKNCHNLTKRGVAT